MSSSQLTNSYLSEGLKPPTRLHSFVSMIYRQVYIPLYQCFYKHRCNLWQFSNVFLKKTWNMDEKKVSSCLVARSPCSIARLESALFVLWRLRASPMNFSPVHSKHPYETGHLGIPNFQTKPYINILVYQLKYNN